MRNVHKSLAAICLTIALFSCSKKVQTFRFGAPYYQENTARTNVIKSENEELSDKQSIASSIEVETPVIEPEAVIVAKDAATFKTPESKVNIEEEKPAQKLSLKEKLTKKVVKKFQKQEGRSGVGGNLRIGIIIAAIGLLLLIIAGVGGFGGASGVFWVLGAVALVIGLIIVLLEVI